MRFKMVIPKERLDEMDRDKLMTLLSRELSQKNMDKATESTGIPDVVPIPGWMGRMAFRVRKFLYRWICTHHIRLALKYYFISGQDLNEGLLACCELCTRKVKYADCCNGEFPQPQREVD